MDGSRGMIARALEGTGGAMGEISLTEEQEAELVLSLEEADRDEVIPWETALEQLRRG